MSDWLQWVMMICMGALLVTGALCLYRIVIGPRAGDRAVGLDTMAMVFVGVITIGCMLEGTSLYFDAVWILTLVGFIGTAAIAKYLERGKVF